MQWCSVEKEVSCKGVQFSSEERVVTGMRWTGLPGKSSDQISIGNGQETIAAKMVTKTAWPIPERPFTGVSGPSGPKIAKKVSKRVFWGSAEKSPKIPEKVKKYPKKSNFGSFDFFGCFRGPLCRPPKRLFLRLFCDFGPGGPGDSCKWLLGSQSLANSTWRFDAASIR